ncbi:hypothetical protein [Micromonospora sp. WMMD1082]|uniref:hypothetical protein n=1 Tax=Micromonospora sp. WMMD1082 TaxID=3016104 RepID=UPI002415B0EC|nr:hypothetical protein [Micromonospora sp. WMMD1082]MDG4796454.1 hypothetical protein [Micromonospora sp. WMMD1082]
MILLARTGCRRVATATVALAMTLGVAGCPSTPATPTGPDRAAPAAGGSAPAPVGEEVDGCSLLTDAEVTEVIGANPGGVPTSAGCAWENPQTSHSVTLHIGMPGTAAEGALPPADPILGEPEESVDGIRFSVGEAEFAGGDRYCTLRVVTSVVDDRDRSTTIRLVGLVRDRL